jgi:hypothetical protein
VPSAYDPKTGQLSVKLWNQWMGWTDLRDWVSGEPYKIFTDLANPLIKVPVELMSNHSFYTEENIERYPGEPYGVPFLGMNLSKKMVHGLKTIRAVNEMNKLIQGKTEAGEKPLWARVITASGVQPKEYSFDVAKLKKGREYEIEKRSRELKRTVGQIKKKYPARAFDIVEVYKKEIVKQ